MGSATVRRAIVDYFDPPAVDGLVKVYAALPVYADATEWEFGAGRPWAAIGFVHLMRASERRIAMGGATGGIKMVVWDVALVVLYRYVIGDIPVDSDESEWTNGLDLLMDSVVSHIRANRIFDTGANGAIWQAGEGDRTDNPDIVIERDLPMQDAGMVHQWQTVKFNVVEMVDQA